VGNLWVERLLGLPSAITEVRTWKSYQGYWMNIYIMIFRLGIRMITEQGKVTDREDQRNA
jgi:hypothetical protein